MPYYLLLPCFAAILYALGSMAIKRAFAEGTPAGQSFYLSNLVLGLIFLPLLGFGVEGVDWTQGWKPMLMGTTFFAGQGFTFAAIRRGDVSLVTPLMGTKVVFVALGVVAFTGSLPSRALGLAALLTTLGILVMGLADFRGGSHVFYTIAVALMSAAVFGLNDVLVNVWAPGFGALPFLAIGCGTVAVWSLVMWICQGRPAYFPKGRGAKWVWAGSAIIAFQALVLGLALAYFDDATGVNVVYASRGLWVITLVVVLGPLLGNHEHRDKGRGFLWRVGGTLLLTLAIVIAVIDRAHHPALSR